MTHDNDTTHYSQVRATHGYKKYTHVMSSQR